MNTLAQLGAAQGGATLASMGQKYRDLPPAPFADRFGAPVTPEQERAQALQLFLQEQQKYQEEQRQRQRTPEYTWPAGFIRL
jgi:hypothetical protein